MATATPGKRLFIVNPTAYGGRGAGRWQELQSRLRLAAAMDQVVFTRRAGEAEQLAAAAIGFRTVVAAGGDGTVSEVISGIMQHPAPRPRLGVIPLGTGNDIAHLVGAGSDDAAVALLDGGTTRTHDLLRIEYETGAGSAVRHAFIFGTAGFSASASVAPWMKRWLPPVLAYYLGMLVAIVRFRPPRMAVTWPGGRYEGDTWMVVAANAEWAGGGGMRIAPGARTDDRQIYVTIIPARSKFEICTRLLPRVGTGDHVREPGVEYFTVDALAVECTPAGIVDLDGDAVGLTPVQITLSPAAIEILSAPGQH